MLIEQKRNLKKIQKLMGHEHIKTTLNIYGHLIEKAESSKSRSTAFSQLYPRIFLVANLWQALCKPQKPAA